MHILIDAQALQSPTSRGRGIGRYARALLAALVKASDDWRFELVVNAALPAPPAEELAGLSAVPFSPPVPGGAEAGPANERYLGDWISARRPDVALLLSVVDEEILVPRFSGARPLLVSVAYDLIPLLFHEQYLGDPRTREVYGDRIRLLAGSDLLLAISEATARDVRTLLALPAARVVAIGGAPDPEFRPPGADELARTRPAVERRYGLTRPYVLYVGGFDPRKNMAGAIEAFALLPPALREAHDLVIACKAAPEERDRLLARAREAGVGGHVRVTGFVSDEALRTLYASCRVFFFPSLYEGLGLPIVEALACGAPVVAGDVSAMPEVAGPTARLADPADPSALAAALAGALGEPRERDREARLAHAGTLTWARTAALARAAIRGLLPRREAPRRARPRVAFVSPWPPAASGIADYSAELLTHLEGRYDIELVSDLSGPLVEPALAARHRVVRADRLAVRHRARPYDLFVYQIGNSSFHAFMLPLLRRFPGLLVLHDLELSGLLASSGGAPPARGGVDADRAPACAPLLASADAVLVHSAWTWARVRAACDTPVLRVPQAMAARVLPPPAELRAALGLGADRFVVSTLGLVGPPKRLPSLLRALAALPPPLRDRAELHVAGEAPSAARRELEELAGSLGIAHALRLHGRVPLEALYHYARAADACVLMRYPSHGETSASLLRAMACGSACVISASGSMAEVPEDAALRVRSPRHEVEDLRDAIVRLDADPTVGAALRAAGARYVRERCAFDQVASGYAAAMELAMERRARRGGAWAELLLDDLAGCAAWAGEGDLMRAWSELRVRGQRDLALVESPT